MGGARPPMAEEGPGRRRNAAEHVEVGGGRQTPGEHRPEPGVDVEDGADAAEAGEFEAPKLQQSEAIMEAIIRSTNPLLPGVGPPQDDRFSPAWLQLQLQRVSDRLVPWWWLRWLSLTGLLSCFIVRVVLIERQFFAAYALAIYVLNQLLLFLSPATEDDGLPMAPAGVEYRPFARALSEFKLWARGFVATAAAFVATFLDICDLDVDGSALALYFVVLFGYTMKQQIVHMYTHGYVPWSSGKKTKKRVEHEKLDV